MLEFLTKYQKGTVLITFFFSRGKRFSFLALLSLNKAAAWAVLISSALRTEMVVPKVGSGREREGEGSKSQCYY